MTIPNDRNINSGPIGILGGMGPEATVLLQQKLISATPAEDDDDHIPLLIDMNPQVPSRIAHLIEEVGEDPGPTLAAMARRLENAGARALAMPCNTAHFYAPAIVEAVGIPLLNMVDIAADHALTTLGTGGRVGMLASPAVRKTNLFEDALQARGLTSLWPDDTTSMLTAIRAIKANGACKTGRDILSAASTELLNKGAGLQLIACSEFSIIADGVAPGVRVVDSLDLLVSAIISAQTETSPPS